MSLKPNPSTSFRAKKSLGQNFLMHRSIAERIVAAADVTEKDTVLEIGPGRGLLTRALLARAKCVVAVEADQELIPELSALFASEIASGKLELLHADIREFSTDQLPTPYKIVANIPYYISGEIMRQFLTDTHQPSTMTLLVQKEVAVRIARNVKESLLSLSVKAFGEPVYCFTVPSGAFVPAPNVDSAVLAIQNINRRNFESTAHELAFFDVIRAGFAHKRKFLARNLEVIATPETVRGAFLEAKIPNKARAEDISLATWLALVRAIHRK